jgi:hypothetical protein
MTELLKLLDSSIDDVKTGIAGKSRDDLTALRKAEADGKTRKGVLDAIDAALAATNTPAATEFEASGAPHQIVSDVDVSHPAVDADPRANTTAEQNRIDFNDPTISGSEAVERSLAAQSTEGE